MRGCAGGGGAGGEGGAGCGGGAAGWGFRGDADGDAAGEAGGASGDGDEWIRVGVYYFTEKDRAEIEILAPSLDGPRFRKGQRVPLAIPVREGLTPGTYRVEVQPCGPGAACGGHAAAKFNVEL